MQKQDDQQTLSGKAADAMYKPEVLIWPSIACRAALAFSSQAPLLISLRLHLLTRRMHLLAFAEADEPDQSLGSRACCEQLLSSLMNSRMTLGEGFWDD